MFRQWGSVANSFMTQDLRVHVRLQVWDCVMASLVLNVSSVSNHSEMYVMDKVNTVFVLYHINFNMEKKLPCNRTDNYNHIKQITMTIFLVKR